MSDWIGLSWTESDYVGRKPLHSPLSTLYSLLSTLHSPLSTLHSSLFTLYSPLSTIMHQSHASISFFKFGNNDFLKVGLLMPRFFWAR